MDPGRRQGADRARGGGCPGLTLTLTEALGIVADDVVALVGGGGKTTAMFRLAREIAERGEQALTTTTTHIFGEQIALAPGHAELHPLVTKHYDLDVAPREDWDAREADLAALFLDFMRRVEARAGAASA